MKLASPPSHSYFVERTMKRALTPLLAAILVTLGSACTATHGRPHASTQAVQAVQAAPQRRAAATDGEVAAPYAPERGQSLTSNPQFADFLRAISFDPWHWARRGNE